MAGNQAAGGGRGVGRACQPASLSVLVWMVPGRSTGQDQRSVKALPWVLQAAMQITFFSIWSTDEVR